MASRVECAVSILPITTIAASAGANAATDVIEPDINKGLSASYSVTIGASGGHTTVGYSGGTVAYASAPVSGDSPLQLGADNTAYKAIFIKHTGFVYSSPTALGAASTDSLNVYLESVAALANYTTLTIPPGGAIVLPQLTALANCGIHVRSSGSGTVAVEYALII
jgi:hypothetical protein